MQGKQTWKIALLGSVIALALILSGCTGQPDKPSINGKVGATQGGMPFPELTPSPTPRPSPTTTSIKVTLTPGPGESGAPSPGASRPAWMGPGTAGPGIATPVGSIGPATPLVSKAPSPSPKPTASVLKVGSTGDAVRSLQQRLKQLGYLASKVDGDFGKGTESAVIAFQKRHGLTADGIAGNATLEKIYSNSAKRAAPTPQPTRKPTTAPKVTRAPEVRENVYLRVGSSGADVKKLQVRLIQLGYLAGAPTGYYNEATEAAVIAFQKRNVSYSDGVAGPMTLSKLNSAGAKGTSTIAGIIGVTLRKGMADSAAVRAMQSRLKELRYYNGAADGDFGAGTEAAVKFFQQQNNLKADGVAGEGTLNIMFSTRNDLAPGRTVAPNFTPVPPNATLPAVYNNVTPNPAGGYVTLRFGDGGTLVRNLQQALKNQGYLKADVDGKYGLATVDAVKSFQVVHGLSQDGIAGPATQRVLYEGKFPAGS